MHPDLKRLVHTWFQELWNEKRVSTIDRMMSPDATVQLEGLDGEVSREELKEYCRAFLSGIPDLRADLHQVIQEDETCIAHWRVRGTHLGHGLGIPPTGRSVDVNGVSTFFFRDGIVVGGYDRWNRGELLARLMEVRTDEVVALDRLTARESEVALLMAERLTHAEIADRLGISGNTARRHCEHVLSKLGVSRRQGVAGALGKVNGSVLDRHGSDLPDPDKA